MNRGTGHFNWASEGVSVAIGVDTEPLTWESLDNDFSEGGLRGKESGRGEDRVLENECAMRQAIGMIRVPIAESTGCQLEQSRARKPVGKRPIQVESEFQFVKSRRGCRLQCDGQQMKTRSSGKGTVCLGGYA